MVDATINDIVLEYCTTESKHWPFISSSEFRGQINMRTSISHLWNDFVQNNFPRKMFVTLI